MRTSRSVTGNTQIAMACAIVPNAQRNEPGPFVEFRVPPSENHRRGEERSDKVAVDRNEQLRKACIAFYRAFLFGKLFNAG